MWWTKREPKQKTPLLSRAISQQSIHLSSQWSSQRGSRPSSQCSSRWRIKASTQARTHLRTQQTIQWNSQLKMITLPIANALEVIPSNWPLLGHVLENSSISESTNTHPSGHHGYRCLDLKLLYNLENESHVVFWDTYTHGSFEVFVMVTSVHLSLVLPKKQFTLPKQGLPTFIRSGCYTKFKQSGQGSLISCRQLNSSTN